MSRRLRVASFNIRNGRAFDGLHSWPFRRHTTAAVIGGLDADIIGLQEAFGFQLKWLMRRVSDYAAFAEGRDNGHRGERCAVLTRPNGVVVSEARTHWYGDTPDRPGSRMHGASFPRTVTICRLDLLDPAATVVVANTHLDEAIAANRSPSVEQLIGWLDPNLPCVVVGDFNADADDALFMGF